MINSTVKDSFTVAKGWRKRGAGRIKLMNTTQTQVRSTDEALSVFDTLKLALEALEKVSKRSVIMGSTGDYREGQLDALSSVSQDVALSITAIKEALMSLCDGTQQPQDVVRGLLSNEQVDAPVAWMWFVDGKPKTVSFGGANNNTPKEWSVLPLYTHPPVPYVVEPRNAPTKLTAQPKWIGLTIEDKHEYLSQDFGGSRADAMDWAEKRLKEKNNGT